MLKHQEYLKKLGIERHNIKHLANDPDRLYNSIQLAMTSYQNFRAEENAEYYCEHIKKLYQLLDELLPDESIIRNSKSYKNVKAIFNF